MWELYNDHDLLRKKWVNKCAGVDSSRLYKIKI